MSGPLPPEDEPHSGQSGPPSVDPALEALKGVLRETIESRSTVQHALDDQVRKYGDLTTRAPFGVVHVDSEGRYNDLNPAMLGILDCEADVLIDRRIGSCGEPSAWIDVLRQFFEEPELREAAHGIRVFMGGEMRHLEIHLGRDRDGGRFAAFVADRTRQAMALSQARRFAAEARAANEAKSNFLAVMSHELRTPMNGMLGMAAMLSEGALTDSQRELVETIRSSGEGLLGIINDILDFSKVESGMLESETVPFALREVLDGVIDVVRPRILETGLRLHLAVAPTVPPRLMGDPHHLRQVLINLVGNAVKFTHEGSVTIRVLPLAEQPGHLRFQVEDTGIGIAAEALPRLFDSFVQAERSTTRRFGGTGLGLSITRGLVLAMQGSLHVESTGGEGSIFSFDLPLAVDETACAASPHPMAIEVAMEGPCAITVRSLLSLIGSREEPSGERPMITITRETDARRLTLCRGARRIELDTPLSHHRLERAIRTLSADEWVRGAARVPEESPLPQLDLEVLLVEDNEVNRRIAAHFLRRLGCAVTIACDGNEAVARASERLHDVILMDIEMPELDGFGATAAIRELDGARAQVPIIALTANAIHGDAARCLAAGMDAYLSKPYTLEQLMAELTRTLQLQV